MIEPWYKNLSEHDSASFCSNPEKEHLNRKLCDYYYSTEPYKDRRLSFKPDTCDLQQLEVSRIMKLLSDTGVTIVLIGDSLSGIFYRWLSHAFSPTLGEPVKHFTNLKLWKNHGSVENAIYYCYLQNNLRVRLVYFVSYLIEPREKYQQLFQIMNVTSKDIVIMNYGEWYGNSINRVKELVSNMRKSFSHIPSEWPRFVWRERLRQHFPYSTDCSFDPSINLVNNCSVPTERTKPEAVDVVNEAWAKLFEPAIILKINLPTIERSDEHMPKFGLHINESEIDMRLADCTHYIPCSSTFRLLGTMAMNLVEVMK